MRSFLPMERNKHQRAEPSTDGSEGFEGIEGDEGDVCRCCPVPTAVLVPRSIRKAVLALPGRTSRPERQPSLPPVAARLHQDKPGTDSLSPHRTHDPRAARLLTQTCSALALERNSGHGQQPEAPPFQSLTVLPFLVFCQLAVLVCTPPAPQGERIIGRAPSYHAPPKVLKIRELT